MVVSNKTKSSKTIPYLHEPPLVGSLPAFMKKRMSFLLQVAQTSDVCGFHIGPVPVIMFNKAEHIQSILVDHAYEFSKGRILHKAMDGNGLFISEGEFHRHQRKLMAPVFQPRHIASYADTIVRYGERIQQEWRDGETNVFLSPYTIQRNPTYFPNPEAFNPEHFTLEHEKQLPRYAYIPFGAGPRICIGNYFALMEGQLLIATLAQYTTFTLIPGQTVEPDPAHNLALRPGGRVEAIVNKR